METEQGKKKTPRKVWWFEEQIDIFETKLVRKLRMQENGDSLFAVYHRLRLFAAKNFGLIKVENFGDSPAEDIAFAIQEKPEYVEIVLDVLEKHGLISFSSDGEEILFPEVMERVCTQADSTERTRRWREREKAKKSFEPSQCDDGDATSVTENDGDALQYNTNNTNTTSQENSFDNEKAWEKLKAAYPKTICIDYAKPSFLEIMRTTSEDKRKKVAFLILKAIELYVADFVQGHPNDSTFQYMPYFEKWFKDYAPHWMQVAKQKLEEKAEEERRMEAEAERMRQSEERRREWERLEQEALRQKAEADE